MNEFYARLISRGERIAVAVSGGKDSVALLHFLCGKAEQCGFSVAAVNVEHGIRGERSKADSAFVKELCESWGVPLFFRAANTPLRAENDKLSLEQAARAERYGFFRELLLKGAADKIATAHHSADNVETVLINLFRGSSFKGAAGIPPEREGIIRPFLYTSREEIEEYIRLHSLPFREDETNADTDITRNFIRSEILPRMKKIFPAGERALLRFGETAREEDAFLDELASDSVEERGGAVALRLSVPPALFGRAVLLAMKRAGVRADYTHEHARSVRALKEKQNGAEVSLPGGLIAKREYDKISFFAPQNGAFAETPLAEGKFTFRGKTLVVESCGIEQARRLCGKEKNVFYADGEKLAGAVVRTRKDGDVFEKFGGKTKKLKEYFIDEKIPERLRNDILLIAKGKEIFFSGREISEKVKLDESTVKALKITYSAAESYKTAAAGAKTPF